MTPTIAQAPVDGPSRLPASGPVRTQHGPRNTDPFRRGILVKRDPLENGLATICAGANLKKKEIRDITKQARIAAESEEGASVQCRWNGCTENVLLAALLAHLQTTHDVEFPQSKKVRCLWSRGHVCQSEILGRTLRTHVLSHGKNDLAVKCPKCGQNLDCADTLERHLAGKFAGK
ncbi:hypothetical protein B0H12DRAFT_1125875 [Mycena haematopus]|nr:hypothetical protein B0H12DRAFT_1125875 [Mycena haematopus]